MIDMNQIYVDAWKRVEAAFNRADANGMFEDTAEDAVFYDEFGGKTQGRQEIVDYFDNMFKTAPGMVMRIENTTARVVTPDVILTQSIYSLDMPGEMPALKGSSFTVSRISGDRSIMVELNNKFFAPQV